MKDLCGDENACHLFIHSTLKEEKESIHRIYMGVWSRIIIVPQGGGGVHTLKSDRKEKEGTTARTCLRGGLSLTAAGGRVALGGRGAAVVAVLEEAVGVDGRLGLGHPDHAVPHFLQPQPGLNKGSAASSSPQTRLNRVLQHRSSRSGVGAYFEGRGLMLGVWCPVCNVGSSANRMCCEWRV